MRGKYRIFIVLLNLNFALVGVSLNDEQLKNILLELVMERCLVLMKSE